MKRRRADMGELLSTAGRDSRGLSRSVPAKPVQRRVIRPCFIGSRVWSGDEGRRGAVAVLVALMLVMIIGFVSLGTEVVLLLLTSRQMQSAADAAALGGVTAQLSGQPSDYTQEAFALAAAAGFVNGQNGTTVAVNSPPTTGDYKGSTGAVEVLIAQPQTLALANVVHPGPITVSARAVAQVAGGGAYCVFALDPSACGAVAISNNVTIQPAPCDDQCGVAANSSCNTAITLQNNAAINGPVSTVGNWSLASNAALNCLPKTNHASAQLDPYLMVPLPPSPVPACSPVAGCPNTCTKACTGTSTTVNLNPGHYPFGWNYGNNVTLNLASGVYYIDQQLTLKNNVTVNATGGVTLIINGNYQITLGNNATFNITAPTSGPTAGLAMASIRTATASVTQEFGNNVTLNIKGALYFPNQIFKIDNNGAINGPICAQVIARIVQMQNNAALKDECAGTGVLPIGGGQPLLVQ